MLAGRTKYGQPLVSVGKEHPKTASVAASLSKSLGSQPGIYQFRRSESGQLRVGEQRTDLALRLLEQSVLGFLTMVEPGHFVAEVAAVLARLKPTDAHDAWTIF